MGIQVDSSGQSVDLNKIDNIILKVQECLWKNFENGIPYDVMKTGDCIVDHIDFPLNLSCATIKVVNDWQWSCDGKWQLLGASATAPQELCSSKGLSPDPNCPCRWRAGLQDGNIVVTPDLRMLADPLIRLATGCNNPWGHTLLSMCAQVNIVE
jgi:hypothetical protein